MTLEETLNVRLKEAMRAKNTRETSVLRMVKTEAQAAKTAPGFKGETDDAFWKEVIVRYVKKQARARDEFEKAGEAGREKIEEIDYEIEYFSEFLPKKMGEAEVRELVRRAIEETHAVGPKMVGKVIGFVMKAHKEEVDPAMVKEIAAKELG